MAGTDFDLLTPERVRLRYDVAGIGSRAAAALVDTGVQLACYVALFILVVVLFAWFPDWTDVVPLSLRIVVFVLGVFLLLWGYYLLFEMAWSGQTPGKRMVGIRVLRENGYPIRPVDAVIRNLIRIVDGPPAGFVVGLIVMLLNERARRLGDYAAGTIVVREAKRQSVASLTAAFATAAPSANGAAHPTTTDGAARGAGTGTAAEAPASRVAVGVPLLSGADATLVRDFLVRRHAMEPDARTALARRLADALARRYGLAPAPPARAEAFLEGVSAPPR
jgi:uncharacterized RDD family membrane protein YckC